MKNIICIIEAKLGPGEKAIRKERLNKSCLTGSQTMQNYSTLIVGWNVKHVGIQIYFLEIFSFG